MANASTTQASSASDTTGTPIPLSYGYVWVTGKRDAYYTIQDTGNDYMDYHRVGRWMLGHGEWDGCIELWINDLLTWRGNVPAAAPPGFSGQNWLLGLDGAANFVFNFHSGCDSLIGSGLAPSSSGPDQGCDVLCAQFPSAINPLDFSRIAYYMIMRKQKIANQTNDHRSDPSQWGDVNPIGLWRALRCRLFDDSGNMTGYAFTTNPAWHFVDVILRRRLFPDYGLDLAAGPDDLTQAIRNRFNWASIYNSAQYYDEILANGRRRFEGNYTFSGSTSLQAMIEQILLNSRSYWGDYAGEIYLNCDQPRASVFTFSREHILPGSFDASDQTLTNAPNRYISTFRDVLIPAAAQIAGITAAGGGARPEVTTVAPHPFNAGDWIAMGGTDTVYDGEWQVYSVPAVIDVGTPEEVDPSTLVLVSKGANYPASVGAGGSMGLLYSRFKERSPEFWHKANMLARGVVGVGIARWRNKVKLALDFATSTYDQVSRISRYERDRTLGADTTGSDGKLDAPYVTPPFVKLRTSMFAMDASGNLVAAIQPGDRVTVDDTLSFTYAGDYEAGDIEIFPPSTDVHAEGGTLQRLPSASSGEIEFTLLPYSEPFQYDDSDDLQAGWPSVPGSDPGNESNYTQIDLASGGVFVFFTGQQASGTQLQLPSSGFPAGNLIAWASPAGAAVSYHSAHIVKLCDASAARLLSLIYDDCEGTTWGGDIGFGALSWLSTDVPTTSGGLQWLEFTLLGGEKIIFGQGILADGATVALPSPYVSTKMFAVAYMHDQASDGNIMFLAGAYIDSGLVVHFDVSDDSGHTWHGNANVLIFAWQDNMSSVTTETIDGANWMELTITNGKKFGVGCQLGMSDGDVFHIPAAAGDGSTLQIVAGSSYGQYEAGSNHAQGVGACYVDANMMVHISFNDGNPSDAAWYGKADVFALYCTSGSAAPVLVTVSPASASVPAGNTQQFTAIVTNNANQSVVWSVDGIIGGNVTVGTVDSTGLYAAPNSPGSHTITATSVADPTASGSSPVAVWGSITTDDFLTDDAGNPIYANGDEIYTEGSHMTLLTTVIADGTFSARPAAGIAGRIFFATDTKRSYRDNGTTWDDVTPAGAAATLSATPSAPGNFTMAHGLTGAPSQVLICMTSPGGIWFQSPTLFDGTNVYLVASDAGVTAQILVFA